MRAMATGAGCPSRPSLRELTVYFLGLGAAGFGGPIALVGAMDRDFVDRRGWATRQELKDGLAFAQLAPGPLAAQLAMYLGWLCAGVRGATVAGVAFVAPSFAIVLVLAVLYVRFGGLSWLAGAFYGIGAAVIAVIARSAVKLAHRTLERDALMGALFGVSAVVTAWRESEVAWLFLLCGVVAMVARSARLTTAGAAAVAAPGAFVQWQAAFALVPQSASLVGAVFLYFASAGLFVFGSGLAIVPFLHGGVVERYHWLTERQFLDAVAVALITPGPVVIAVAFIGYLVAGVSGAVAAAAGVFAPVYVATVVAAPYYERLRASARVRAFVEGVTAAATGAIAGAAFVLGRRAITDVATAAIALGTLAVLVRARRVPEPVTILAAGLVGVVVRG